jgi:hypothetical protein
MWPRADALAGRVIDGVGDGRGGADDADLAEVLNAQRRHFWIGFIDEDHLDVDNVGMCGDVILGEA